MPLCYQMCECVLVFELDRQSNDDEHSVRSDKSVILPAVSFGLGGDETDTESQASTLERNYSHPTSSKR